jgi:enolase-phosphatase E1
MLSLTELGVRAVLLDIEGTTTPISFVHDVLFPYARTRLREYLRRQEPEAELAEVRQRFADEHAQDAAHGERPPALLPAGADGSLDAAVAYAEWLMDRDRKSPALKLLQGLIWEGGYQAGELRGLVFSDVPAALRRWRDAGLRIAIYSSGSELAQRRLFESTESGNLAPLVSGFFDTSVGPKFATSSYERIAVRLGLPASAVMFVSDVTKELDAARAAGFQVALSVRPGNAAAPAHSHAVVTSLTDLTI